MQLRLNDDTDQHMFELRRILREGPIPSEWLAIFVVIATAVWGCLFKSGREIFIVVIVPAIVYSAIALGLLAFDILKSDLRSKVNPIGILWVIALSAASSVGLLWWIWHWISRG